MARGWDQKFVTLLESEKMNLVSFVLALVGDRHVADDLYQNTCLELWRIRRTFRAGTDFGAWARTVARYQVLRHFRKRKREKVHYSSETVSRIAAAYASPPAENDSRETRAALASCLKELSEEQRRILKNRYNDGNPIRTLANENGRSEVGIKVMLLRLRQRLARCVKSKLKGAARTHE